MNMVDFAQYCIETGYRGKAIDKAKNQWENTIILEFKEGHLYNLNTGREITFESFFFDWNLELLDDNN